MDDTGTTSERDAQRDRAIRRATEAVARIARPADWRPRDYTAFELALRANGYELVKVEEPTDG